MTYRELKELIEVNSIPEDVILKSDSGWEMDATNMNGVFYNPEKNTIVFTMDPDDFRSTYANKPWVRLEASQK